MVFLRSKRTPAELDALFEIVVGTSDALGEDYFNALSKSMAAALDVRYAFVSVFTRKDTHMRIVSLWDGEAFRDVGEYDIRTSPCREVMKGTEYFCAKDVQGQFPEDPAMKMFGAQSYRGVPMIGATGRHFGHIAAVDTKPIKSEPRFTTIMQICATRAAAEMERTRADATVRETTRRLEAVLDSTRDAILTIDEGRIIRIVNRATESMLRTATDQIVGVPLDRFFSRGVLDDVMRCTSCLAESASEHACLWLREGLTSRRADGSNFPVEASIAPVEIEGKMHYTLVVRDIEERSRAQVEIAQLSLRAEYLAGELGRSDRGANWIGESPAIREVVRKLDLVSATDSTVLLTGESGTGKELAAKMVHDGSERRSRPLVKVDCASLPENLIESELFGHEKGAFTGATAQRLGRFELADTGTVFLDEIGELPLALQAKLLRVIEEREFQRVGGEQTIRVDVRIVAATNRDLRQMVEEKRFREDLYFRLSVFPIELPALRERVEDIPLLAEHFLRRSATKIGREVDRINDEGLAALVHHPWPGNIRELKNVMERSVVVSTGPTLALDLSSLTAPPDSEAQRASSGTLRDAERQHIVDALERTGGIIEGARGAAAMLDIHPSTLRNRMRKLGLR